MRRQLIGVVATVAVMAGGQAAQPGGDTADGSVRTASATATYTFTRAKGPARTIVRDATGAWVATFTDGARSVVVSGPSRRFEEGAGAGAVTSKTWVRVLASRFSGRVDVGWLERVRADTSPDVLQTAMHFVAGSPDVVGADGLLAAADASYGPLQADGSRQEGADWNDFQGVTATYPDATDAPEPAQARSLDCSGFMRMLWGRRFAIPLGLRPDGGATMPRRAVEQAASAPGVVPIANTQKQVTDLRGLQPGDLVFFDASSDDGTAVDHVGMYLGPDAGDRHRFISSRKSADGPTMGDLRGASVLDGTGLYARSFRSSRRL